MPLRPRAPRAGGRAGRGEDAGGGDDGGGAGAAAASGGGGRREGRRESEGSEKWRRKNEELFSSAKSVKKEKVCRKVEVFLPCSRSFSASTSESVLSCYTRIVVWCPPFLGEKGQKEGERKNGNEKKFSLLLLSRRKDRHRFSHSLSLLFTFPSFPRRCCWDSNQTQNKPINRACTGTEAR
jgi:hypothetical protein